MIKLKSMALNEQKNPEYNSKVWNGLGDKDRYDALASVNKKDGPDYADEYMYENDWSKIPDEITRHIDLTRYKDKMVPLNHVAKLTGAKQVIALMGEMKKIGKRNKVTKRRRSDGSPKNVRVEQEHPGTFCIIKQDTDWYWNARGNNAFPGRETLDDYHIYAYDRYHTQIKEIANKIRSYYDNKNDADGDIGTVSESKKIKLKDLLTEKGGFNPKRFRPNEKDIPQHVWDASPGHSDRPYIFDPEGNAQPYPHRSSAADTSKWKIYVNYITYTGEFGSTEYLESDWHGDDRGKEYIYDLIDTGDLTSNITVDCELHVGRAKIDFEFEVVGRDSIQHVMIQDDEIANELGIDEAILGDFIQLDK